MIVICATCDRRYDDEYRWTICPHDPLESGPGRPYCTRHDLFNCPFHKVKDGIAADESEVAL